MKPKASQSPLRSTFSSLPAWILMLLGLVWVPQGRSHNLDQLDTSIAFDKATLDMMAARAGLNQSLFQAGESIGLLLSHVRLLAPFTPPSVGQ